MGQTRRPADIVNDLKTIRRGAMPTGTKAKPAPPTRPTRPTPTTGAQASALGAAIKKNLPAKKR